MQNILLTLFTLFVLPAYTISYIYLYVYEGYKLYMMRLDKELIVKDGRKAKAKQQFKNWVSPIYFLLLINALTYALILSLETNLKSYIVATGIVVPIYMLIYLLTFVIYIILDVKFFKKYRNFLDNINFEFRREQYKIGGLDKYYNDEKKIRKKEGIFFITHFIILLGTFFLSTDYGLGVINIGALPDSFNFGISLVLILILLLLPFIKMRFNYQRLILGKKFQKEIESISIPTMLKEEGQ